MKLIPFKWSDILFMFLVNVNPWKTVSLTCLNSKMFMVYSSYLVSISWFKLFQKPASIFGKILHKTVISSFPFVRKNKTNDCIYATRHHCGIFSFALDLCFIFCIPWILVIDRMCQLAGLETAFPIAAAVSSYEHQIDREDQEKKF